MLTVLHREDISRGICNLHTAFQAVPLTVYAYSFWDHVVTPTLKGNAFQAATFLYIR